MAMGLGFYITAQAVINIAVVTKSMPNKGIALPFVSYGGSSIVANFILLALLLRAGDAATGREVEIATLAPDGVLGRVALSRRLARTASLVALLMVALVLNLTYVQVIQADDLAANPASTRGLAHEMRSPRGAIVSSDGVVLAESVPEGDIYARIYPQGALGAHVVGYYDVRYGRAGIEAAANDALTGQRVFKTWQDAPDDLIIEVSKGNIWKFLTYPTMDRSQGKYFDWVWGYNFRSLLKGVYSGEEVSYSENYVKYFETERELDAKYTEIARFVNMWNVLMPFKDLLRPEVAGCYITLAVTAPGKVVWIGVYQLPPQNNIIKEWNGKVLIEWYKRLILIKKGYSALQSMNIENALISPRIPRLIAYNRWDANTSVTVIVNAGNEHVTANIRTRFHGDSVRLIDLLSTEIICGKPESLRVEMPPRSARILVEYEK